MHKLLGNLINSNNYIMEFCLLGHAEVEFLFCLNAIIKSLTVLFRNVQVICRGVRKSSQFVAVSDMICVIILFVPFSFEGTSYFIWQFLSCFPSPYWAFVCCCCRIATKLSCNIWNLTFNTQLPIYFETCIQYIWQGEKGRGASLAFFL